MHRRCCRQRRILFCDVVAHVHFIFSAHIIVFMHYLYFLILLCTCSLHMVVQVHSYIIVQVHFMYGSKCMFISCTVVSVHFPFASMPAFCIWLYVCIACMFRYVHFVNGCVVYLHVTFGYVHLIQGCMRMHVRMQSGGMFAFCLWFYECNENMVVFVHLRHCGVRSCFTCCFRAFYTVSCAFILRSEVPVSGYRLPVVSY